VRGGRVHSSVQQRDTGNAPFAATNDLERDAAAHGMSSDCETTLNGCQYVLGHVGNGRKAREAEDSDVDFGSQRGNDLAPDVFVAQ